MQARIARKERIKRKLIGIGIAIGMPLAFFGMQKTGNVIQKNLNANTAAIRIAPKASAITSNPRQRQQTQAQTAKKPAKQIFLTTANRQVQKQAKPQQQMQEKTRQTAKPAERKNYSDLRIQNGKQSLSVPTINKILQGTPMQAKGALMQKFSLKYNVDPAPALAFF